MTSLDLNNRTDVPLKNTIDGGEELTAVFNDTLYVVTVDSIVDKAIGDVTWDDVSNKPTEFPPSPHTHAIADVTGLQSSLDSKALATDLANYALASRTISAGSGLTGGGDLTANRTLALSSTSLASLALANTAVQPSFLGDLATKDLVAISDIDASGAASGTTVLYGDGTWRTPAGGGDLFSANNLSDLTNVATARTNLGLGTLATLSSVNNANWSGADLALVNGGTGASDATGARTNLGLGTLATKSAVAIADITATGTPGNTTFLRGDGSWQVVASGGGDLLSANNLSDLANITTARTNLGLGSLATLNSVNNANWSGTALAIGNGGTGATTATAARTNLGLGAMATKAAVAISDITATGTPSATNFLRGDGSWQTASGFGDLLAANNLSDVASAATSRTNLGLGNVDNTSDANKPVSTATQTALNLKANLASPALTGTPTAPTATGGTNTTQIATTAFVTAAVAAVPAAPSIATQTQARTTNNTTNPLGVATTIAANAVVTLTDAATILLDFNGAINMVVTLSGNRTLDLPSNMIAGRSGIILVKQDGTGSRTLSYNAVWKFLGGAPTLSTAASSVDMIAYYVEDASNIRCSFIKGT